MGTGEGYLRVVISIRYFLGLNDMSKGGKGRHLEREKYQREVHRNHLILGKKKRGGKA